MARSNKWQLVKAFSDGTKQPMAANQGHHCWHQATSDSKSKPSVMAPSNQWKLVKAFTGSILQPMTASQSLNWKHPLTNDS